MIDRPQEPEMAGIRGELTEPFLDLLPVRGNDRTDPDGSPVSEFQVDGPGNDERVGLVHRRAIGATYQEITRKCTIVPDTTKTWNTSW